MGFIVEELHSGFGSGHHSADKTLQRARERYYWPGMSSDVKLAVRLCKICDQSSNPNPAPKAELIPIECGGHFEIVSMDIVGGQNSLPQTTRGNKYILTIIDLFTKWAEAIPLADQKATTIAKAVVDNWICRHGVPYQILTDQGTNFLSKVFTELCTLLKIYKTRTVAFKPSRNGACERFNRTLKTLVVKISQDEPENWDVQIPSALLAYRTTPHKTTVFTP